MSQPAVVCRNKVMTEQGRKRIFVATKNFMSRQRILCRNIFEEEGENYCRDTLNSVMTMIKANGKGTLSQQSFLCRNING